MSKTETDTWTIYYAADDDLMAIVNALRDVPPPEKADPYRDEDTGRMAVAAYATIAVLVAIASTIVWVATR